MLRGIFLLREAKPSQEHIMIKLIPFENLFCQYGIFVKTRSRTSKAMAFPAKMTQPSSRARTTQYQEKFVNVVVLAVESNALC